MIDARLGARLYEESEAAAWRVDSETFARAVDASLAKAFAGRTPSAHDVSQYVSTLHLRDLALACACAMGDEEAWRHFVRAYRPALYRAADAIEHPSGIAIHAANVDSRTLQEISSRAACTPMVDDEWRAATWCRRPRQE